MSQRLFLKPYIRSEIEQDKHNKIVSIITRNLNSAAYHVMADHIDWDLGAPPMANGYTPDVYARKITDSMVFEVETVDSFNSSYSLNQLKSLLIVSKELDATPYLILPVTIGENKHVQKAQLFLNSNYFQKIKLGGCDIRSGKLKFF